MVLLAVKRVNERAVTRFVKKWYDVMMRVNFGGGWKFTYGRTRFWDNRTRV